MYLQREPSCIAFDLSHSYLSAEKMYEYTGCDFIMIGRAALGNPWIFTEINDYFEYGKTPVKPSLEERLSIMKKHIEGIVENKGEEIGMREARKHAAYYLKGFHKAASLRSEAFSMTKLSDLYNLIDKIKLKN